MPERIALRPQRRVLLAAVLLVAAAPTLPGLRTPAHASPAWLTRLNAFRTQAGLQPVAEDAGLEQGISNHARYIVKTDDYQHGEDSDSPYYTSSGDEAGEHSNITVRQNSAGGEVTDVDQWLAAPFHALGLLHPRLRASSYANYYEAGSPGYSYAAGIDVLSSRDGADPTSYPMAFPSDGMVLPTSLSTVADEVPNPLTPCGYSLPAGLPVLVSYGPSVTAPVVTDFSLTRDGTPVEACAVTAADYTDRTASAMLADNNTVLLIPRAPLAPGRTYAASVTASGVTKTTTFEMTRLPASVGIELSRAHVDCGGTLDVFGRLSTGYGSPVRQPLELWRRGAGDWEYLRTDTTDKDGRVTFRNVRPDASTEYQVRYAGNGGNLPARSAVRGLVVHPTDWTVDVDRTEFVYLMADSMTISGETRVGGGARLGIQQQNIDETWTRVEDVSGTAGQDGRFDLSVPLGRPGRYVYRVVAYGSGCHRTGVSEPVTVTVAMSSVVQ